MILRENQMIVWYVQPYSMSLVPTTYLAVPHKTEGGVWCSWASQQVEYDPMHRITLVFFLWHGFNHSWPFVHHWHGIPGICLLHGTSPFSVVYQWSLAYPAPFSVLYIPSSWWKRHSEWTTPDGQIWKDTIRTWEHDKLISLFDNYKVLKVRIWSYYIMPVWPVDALSLSYYMVISLNLAGIWCV